MDSNTFYIITISVLLFLIYLVTRRKVKVIDVIDGDTIKIEFPLPPFGFEKVEKIRFIGVDTPETKHPAKGVQRYGKEAFAYTRERLLHKKVVLKFDKNKRDKYGRLLGYIYLHGRMFNAELIRKGFARAYLSYPFKYKKRFIKLQNQAKQEKQGLWNRGKKGKWILLLIIAATAAGVYLFVNL